MKTKEMTVKQAKEMLEEDFRFACSAGKEKGWMLVARFTDGESVSDLAYKVNETETQIEDLIRARLLIANG